MSAYRCAECANRVERCSACRLRRANARRNSEARHMRAGTCRRCGMPPLEGQTMCAKHAEANLRHSASSRRNAS